MIYFVFVSGSECLANIFFPFQMISVFHWIYLLLLQTDFWKTRVSSNVSKGKASRNSQWPFAKIKTIWTVMAVGFFFFGRWISKRLTGSGSGFLPGHIWPYVETKYQKYYLDHKLKIENQFFQKDNRRFNSIFPQGKKCQIFNEIHLFRKRIPLFSKFFFRKKYFFKD